MQILKAGGILMYFILLMGIVGFCILFFEVKNYKEDSLRIILLLHWISCLITT